MSSAMPLVATAVRRDLLTVLAGPDALSTPAATASVAESWSERRRRFGLSPSSAGSVAALTFGMALEEVPGATRPRRIRCSREERP